MQVQEAVAHDGHHVTGKGYCIIQAVQVASRIACGFAGPPYVPQVPHLNSVNASTGSARWKQQHAAAVGQQCMHN